MHALKRQNVVIGVVSLAVIAALLFESTRIAVTQGSSDPGPAAYPQFILALLAVCAVGIILTPDDRTPDDQPRSWKVVALVLASIALYIVLLATIGYIVSTVIFVLIMGLLAGERRWWLLAVYSLGIALILYFVFSNYLSISLPMGLLEELIS